MATKITNAEVMAGITWGIVFLILKGFLVFAGAITAPGAGAFGAYGFVFLTAIVFSFAAILVLGWFGSNLVGDLVAMGALWSILGFIAFMVGFYSFQYFILGLVVVLAASGVASKVHERM